MSNRERFSLLAVTCGLAAIAGSAWAQDSHAAPDWYGITTGAIAGLVLFLVGLDQLAKGFHDVAGDRVEGYIARFTSNPLMGVVTGTIACTLLDSSSVTILAVIAMVHGGLLTFPQALGVVLGANIGTTIGSQIIAYKIHDHASIAMLIGFLLTLLAKKDSFKTTGRILLGFGLLFYGLGQLGDAASPMKTYQPFTEWIAGLGETPVMGALAGGLATVIIQSSSATVGIAITMAMENIIPLAAGIAIMLGAEIGTVWSTIMGSIGRSRATVLTALFHLVFNVTTVIMGLLLIGPLTQLAIGLSPDAGPARHLANAHVAFNVIGVALFIGFTPWIGRWFERQSALELAVETRSDDKPGLTTNPV